MEKHENLYTLEDLPMGSLFEFNETVALKTEYRTESGAIEAFILGSGEMFWGGTDSAEAQRKLIVRKIPYVSYKKVENLMHEADRTGNQLLIFIQGMFANAQNKASRDNNQPFTVK